MKDSPNLDVLRALAVGMVIANHLFIVVNGRDPSGFDTAALGHLGVAIFFVHTTLVLMRSLQRTGGAALPFLVRRFFRIYPLSVAMVLLAAGWRLLDRTPVDRWQVVSNLLLVQNIEGTASIPATLWTLPYEVQMYLLLPALYALTRGRPRVAFALCGGALALSLAAWGASVDLGLFAFVACFLPGLLAFAMAPVLKPRAAPWALFLAVAAAAIAIPVAVSSGLPEQPLLWILCAALGLLIPACRELQQDGTLAHAGKVVARYSYGVYLTHSFALAVIAGPLPVPLWQLVAFCILLPGLAYAAYNGIERHGIALGARLALQMQRALSAGKGQGRESGAGPAATQTGSGTPG